MGALKAKAESHGRIGGRIGMCVVGVEVEKIWPSLDDDDRKFLIDALAVHDDGGNNGTRITHPSGFSGRAVEAALREAGTNLAVGQIARHRRGACSCNPEAIAWLA